MNRPMLTLALLATSTSACVLAADPEGVKLKALDADGVQTGVTDITLQSRIRFSQEGVEVYEGETKAALFPYDKTASLAFITHGSGVAGVSAESPLRLAENPVGDRLELTGASGDTCPLTVFDLSGAACVSLPRWNGEAVDVSRLAPGLYLVTVNSTTLKFIKK